MDIKPNLHARSRSWYRKTWGVLLIFAVIIIILIAAIFIIQITDFTRQINLGNINTEGFSENSQISDTPLGLVSRAELETKDDPTLGNLDATVVIVEFGDFECPFCGKAFPIVREMQTEFKDHVLFIYRDLPLRDIHLNAQKAAEAGECAHEQGKFWEYHDRLFLNQLSLTVPSLKNYARQVGLDGGQFDTCLDSGKYFQEVDEDLRTALEAGAQGTPAFFINGQLVSGVIPRDTFRQIITQLLSEN